MEIFGSLLILILGFVLLIKGADAFVEGASGIAAKFGIPQLVIGLTIVAMGTSLPEAAVSITSALKGSAGIAVGNVLGSNIMNVLLILGITATLIRIPIQRSTICYEIPFMIATTGVLTLFGMMGGEIGRAEGAVLWVLFLCYLAYLFKMQKDHPEEIPAQARELNTGKLLLQIVIGMVVVVLGSNLTVDSATTIARAVGLSERVIGLTIVAFGTSLPELVTSVTAAHKGSADIAIGNIVGSNVFNILFVIGTTALITPVAFSASFLVDAGMAALGGVVLLAGCLQHRELRRPTGILMLALYAAYFAYLQI